MDARNFQQLADLLPEPMLLVTGSGGVVAGNSAAARLCGLALGALPGSTLAELVADPPDQIASLLALWCRTRQPTPGTLRWRTNGRASQEWRVDGAVLRPRSGQSPALIALRLRPKAEAVAQFLLLNHKVQALSREIAERQRAQAALAAEREWLRVTLASIGDAVIAIDWQDRVTYLNPVAERLTGWSHAEAAGRSVREVFTIRDEYTGEPVESPHDKVRRTQAVVSLANHTVLRGRDGVNRPIEDSAAPIITASGEPIGVVMVFHDVTERRRHEAALREREALFRTLADSAPVLIWMSDAAKLGTFFNRTWLEFTGRTPEQELGHGWVQSVHPVDRDRCLQTYMESFDRREPFTVEYRLRRADGVFRWVLDNGVPRFASDGAFEGYIGSVIDVTEQHEARLSLQERQDELHRLVAERTSELEQSQHRLRLAERLASLGTLAAGLGHDMGNLLLPVRMRLDSLEAGRLDASQREDLRAVRTCAEYLQRLAAGLRLLSMSPEPEGTPGPAGPATELGAWWAEVEPVLRNSLPQGIALTHSFPAERIGVRLARHLLTQAVFNLVQNAGQALGPAATGRVHVWAEALSDGEWVRLGVTDNGAGMTDEVRRRCVEPFFTTKTRGISTGLGLSLVQSVASGAGGGLEVESKVGAGSTFTLILPRAPGMGTRASSPDPPLVVLDIADARRKGFVTALLAAWGAHVAPPADEPAPRAAVWITDAGPELRSRIEGFLAVHPGRRAVLLRAWGVGGPRILEVGGLGDRGGLAGTIRHAVFGDGTP